MRQPPIAVFSYVALLLVYTAVFLVAGCGGGVSDADAAKIVADHHFGPNPPPPPPPHVVAKIDPVESHLQYNWFCGKHSSTFVPVSETHYYLIYSDGTKEAVAAEVWAVTPIYVPPVATTATGGVER